ncbi:uncharacterized protein LOC142333979 [Lycorma delicatula]|uniref:uncharacterized protein LOC142333979 n=1 Tax=Lycorma delicatula TaxID=130591 RepID=UPI003F5162F6
MNVPANNSVINESLPLSKNIKLENEQENIGEMISIFLPNHMTESDTSYTTAEHQVDLVRVKEEPLDIINGDIPKDPLAIEETTLIKSENLKVESEVESKISLKDEVLSQLSFNIKTNELQINDKYLHSVKTEEEIGFYPGHVTIDEGIIKGSTTKSFICNFCQKSFHRKHDLKRHINSHTKEKNYICNFCSKSFNESSELNLHFKIHMEEGYICKCCQKSFKNKNNIKAHLNTHTNEKNYVCNFCQTSFHRKYDLIRHIKSHSKEKNYICNFCSKSFNESSELHLHLNIHTEESYICKYCQKSFKNKNNLKIHLNIHTNEKNYFSLLPSKLYVKSYNFLHVCANYQQVPFFSREHRKSSLADKESYNLVKCHLRHTNICAKFDKIWIW